METDLPQLRKNYTKVVEDKKLCDRLIQTLEKQNNSATQVAYLGALQTIWAKHTPNPVSKLSTFRRGKNNLEKAVKSEPNNIEIRFLRHSVQKNIPKFLGYSEHIEEDRRFLQKNKHQVPDPDLKNLIEETLLLKNT
ncbi:hypothetical protein EIZ47_06140 [Chryseobacterium lacus]|uniref:Uncharacterized protein n=2 Tax=Chryseobacterium lacus TaxID=2058346 RepID=A0A368MXS2_9FLAO|nr:hypothetical protein DQ356_06200 [Chryseobacterium lacus]RST28045.1 hypothetical protein EIZ47_06140 [Chryseobacterium lacus]